MAIEPFIKCSDITQSLKFYTEILDFTVISPPHPDPEKFESRHAVLEREGDRIHLDSHDRKAAFGNIIYVKVSDIDPIYKRAVESGLNTSNVGALGALRGGPVEQTWGMKEFWVNDPDGNVVTFGHEIKGVT